MVCNNRWCDSFQVITRCKYLLYQNQLHLIIIVQQLLCGHCVMLEAMVCHDAAHMKTRLLNHKHYNNRWQHKYSILTAFSLFTLAPFDINSFAICIWPCLAARCNGVLFICHKINWSKLFKIYTYYTNKQTNAYIISCHSDGTGTVGCACVAVVI